MFVRASLAALALAGLSLGATTAPAPRHAATAPRHATGTPARTAIPRRSAARPAMPDSVLARVLFTRGQASLTATDYRAAAAKFQLDPDSLGPDARRQVLELLVQQAVLDHRVELAPPRWLHRDSLNFEKYRDAVVIRAALDSATAEMRARFASRRDTIPPLHVLEVMVRDSALARMNVAYDAPGIDSLTAAFLALPLDDIRLPSDRRREIMSMLPRVSDEIRARTLGSFEAGRCTAEQVLLANSSVGAFHRPAVRSSRDVRDLVNNQLYSLVLRRAAQRQGLEARPDVAALLATRHRFLTVQRFVQGEAYDRVVRDTASVRRYYAREGRRYDLGGTAQIVRMLFPQRAQADSAARLLAQPGVAETLSTQSMRPGVTYLTTLGEDADTVLFARVRQGGVGAVIGPDPTADGWRVFKVMSTTPRKPQTLEQAFLRARADWVELDGDRRMRELLAKLVAACRVTVNESSSYLTGRRRPAR